MARYDGRKCFKTMLIAMAEKLFDRLIFAGERLNLVLLFEVRLKKKKKKKKMSIWRGRDSSDISM